MRATIEQAALAAALAQVNAIVPRRTTIPILQNVRLDAAAGRLAITGTDLDLEARTSAPARVGAEGAVTAPCATLHEIARNAPAGAEITLAIDTGKDPRLAVTSGRSRWSLPVLPASDFPVFPDHTGGSRFEVDAGVLQELAGTLYAVGNEVARPLLTGVRLHVHADHGRAVLRTVATNGHRLALADTSAPEGAERMAGVTLPAKTVGEIRRALTGASGPVSIAAGETWFRAEVGDLTLCSKVIEGEWLDYQRVIPTCHEKRLDVDAAALKGAIRRTALIATVRHFPVTLDLEPGRLVIRAANDHAAQAVEDIEVDYDGPASTIGVDARYLTEAIESLEARTVRIAFEDAASPLLITADAQPDRLAIVMPKRA